MRCPYCGGLNPDSSAFCRNCGRDLKALPPQPAAKRPAPPRPAYPAPARPAYGPPPQPPYPVTPVQAPPAPVQEPALPTARQRRPAPQVVPPVPPEPVAPEPPAPFPPRTAAQLQTLAQGALTYSLLSDDESVGSKRIVRVSYPRCAAWQQVATLFKVWQECREDRAKQFNTVIVQGVMNGADDLYSFNNGQLVYDRNVRLGSQLLNRFQIETGNGFAADSIRIVLTENAG